MDDGPLFLADHRCGGDPTGGRSEEEETGGADGKTIGPAPPRAGHPGRAKDGHSLHPFQWRNGCEPPGRGARGIVGGHDPVGCVGGDPGSGPGTPPQPEPEPPVPPEAEPQVIPDRMPPPAVPEGAWDPEERQRPSTPKAKRPFVAVSAQMETEGPGDRNVRSELFGSGSSKELQKAIILQEVLGPPLSLREKAIGPLPGMTRWTTWSRPCSPRSRRSHSPGRDKPPGCEGWYPRGPHRPNTCPVGSEVAWRPFLRSRKVPPARSSKVLQRTVTAAPATGTSGLGLSNEAPDHARPHGQLLQRADRLQNAGPRGDPEGQLCELPRDRISTSAPGRTIPKESSSGWVKRRREDALRKIRDEKGPGGVGFGGVLRAREEDDSTNQGSLAGAVPDPALQHAVRGTFRDDRPPPGRNTGRFLHPLL